MQCHEDDFDVDHTQWFSAWGHFESNNLNFNFLVVLAWLGQVQWVLMHNTISTCYFLNLFYKSNTTFKFICFYDLVVKMCDLFPFPLINKSAPCKCLSPFHVLLEKKLFQHPTWHYHHLLDSKSWKKKFNPGTTLYTVWNKALLILMPKQKKKQRAWSRNHYRAKGLYTKKALHVVSTKGGPSRPQKRGPQCLQIISFSQ